jgi:hypothetical protein
MPCTGPSIPLLDVFRPHFTAPTWEKMLTLLRGTLLARGRRTVTAALWQTGHEQDPHCSAFHQVLNRARWSPLLASRQLLTLIIQTFVQAGGSLDIVIDETLERRWGPKIRTRGHYRDSALSSHARSVSSPGLRWTTVDCAGSCWRWWSACHGPSSGGPSRFCRSWLRLRKSALVWGSAIRPSVSGRAKSSACCGAGSPQRP